jgi:SAM-dependent methyltransferase
MTNQELIGETPSQGAETVPALEFTGERIVPGKTDAALFREHEERYVFAGQYVGGKDVLDVACGTGLGTQYLLEAGAAVCWGIDIDADVITFASASYKGCNFVRGDATDINLPDSSMDVIVSFETIEHVGDQEKFLTECRRVLRPNGRIICSTPNRTMYGLRGTNPFHIHELTPEEFAKLMGGYFGELSLFSQDERNYVIYFLRLFAARVLERLKIKNFVKNVLFGESIAGAGKQRFSDASGKSLQLFKPYRKSLFVQPIYLVAVARKISD